jgi:hypothetical protein
MGLAVAWHFFPAAAARVNPAGAARERHSRALRALI